MGAKYGFPRSPSINTVHCGYFITPMSSNSIGLLGRGQAFSDLRVRLDQRFGVPRRRPSCSAVFVQYWFHTGRSTQHDPAAMAGRPTALSLRSCVLYGPEPLGPRVRSGVGFGWFWLSLTSHSGSRGFTVSTSGLFSFVLQRSLVLK